jgi:NAD(P)-dependent dehydrogenase (short-subunit alcohol dehydrogenase family)
LGGLEKSPRLSFARNSGGPGAGTKLGRVQSFENFFLIKNEFGHLDILFANAGIAKFSPIEETLEKDFDDVLRTNVTAVFLTVQAALALMARGRRLS